MPLSIDDIFRSAATRHSLILFEADQVQWIEARLFDKNGKPYLKCLASDIDRPAKPEEIVRQLWIKRLLDDYRYPKERIKVEYAVWFGSGVNDKSADIVVMHTDGEHPYIIFEVKKPKRKDGLQQLKSYCNAEGAPIAVWTNGGELLILHREEPNIFTQIFDFDLLLTNPPFAGGIGEREILRQYRLAEKNGRTVAEFYDSLLAPRFRRITLNLRSTRCWFRCRSSKTPAAQ